MQIIWAIAAILGQVSVASAALHDSTVQTKYGAVQGVPAFSSKPAGNIPNWQDVAVFKGIPFAADTSGANRWRPPQKRAPWNSTLDASEFGDVCPSTLGGGTTNYTVSEDCLSLNIWTAANSSAAKMPVMFWSTPAASTAADGLFNGGGMASKGVVFVNYNFRTGAFGWLAHPELAAEMSHEVGRNVSGNWGLLDQFAALKWVHENIAAFGGDPDRITVAGQSAGSAAVYHAVNSPLVKGLIKGAIAESGIRDPYDPLAATLAENYRNMSSALTTGASFVASRNVSSIAELRQLTTDDLTVAPAVGAGASTATFSFGAVLDYWAIPNTYINTLRTGPANDVPLITGNAKDESGASTQTNLTVASYSEALQEQYGDEFASRFLALYPANTSTQADMAYNAHYRDTSRVSSWHYAGRWAQSSKSPIYTYLWDHAPPGQDQGAYHESEITYVLNNLYDTDLPWEAEDFVIAEKMNSYWVNFVKTGNPNGGNLTYWPQTTSAKQVTMELGDGWGLEPIGKPAQVKLISDYFATQKPF